MAGYLEALTHDGEWLLRIDDIDENRVVSGMEARIIDSLETLGFQWHGAIVRQTDRKSAYNGALEILDAAGLIYACDCSRQDIAAIGKPGIEGPVYPGTCRTRTDLGPPCAIRLKTDREPIEFIDGIAGRVRQSVARDVGDFVIRRKDGFFAYQLAVVVDDYLDGITDVVRGADLLYSTPRQIYLQRRLGYPSPHYFHVPLVKDAQGRKLSKSDGAHPVPDNSPLQALLGAWQFLRQATPADPPEDVDAFWHHAVTNWQPGEIDKDHPR